MGSSNGTEIGILGTTEAGETPLWKQYTFVCIFFTRQQIEKVLISSAMTLVDWQESYLKLF